MELFKLVGSIMVDSKDAENSISKTESKAHRLGQKLGDGLKTAAKWGAALTGAATAVGGAMIAAAKKTASNLDVIDKASTRMQISAESYQELAHAANLSGVEMSTLEEAAKKLEGTDMNMNDALNEIYALTDAEERRKKAAELFGAEVAYKMTPMLNASAEDMAAMRQEANDLGLVMSDDVVRAGATMNDSFTKIQDSLRSLGTQLMLELLPYVQEVLDWIVENLPIILENARKLIDTIMPYLKPILEGVLSLIQGIFKLINGDIDGFVEDVKQGLGKLVGALLTIGKDAFTALWDGFKEIWKDIKAWVDAKAEYIKNALSLSWDGKTAYNIPDGFHASGLPYVPYDGYTAVLHKGERVVPASQNNANEGVTINLGGVVFNGYTASAGNELVRDLNRRLGRLLNV